MDGGLHLVVHQKDGGRCKRNVGDRPRDGARVPKRGPSRGGGGAHTNPGNGVDTPSGAANPRVDERGGQVLGKPLHRGGESKGTNPVGHQLWVKEEAHWER